MVDWLSRLIRPVTALVIVLAAGCFGPEEPICTANVVYGLFVEIRDSVTLDPPSSQPVATAQSGSYSETLLLGGGPGSTLVAVGAAERPGVYHVNVTALGYATWSRSGVVVEARQCHVEQVKLSALLQPAS